jgi:hypothetical protein
MKEKILEEKWKTFSGFIFVVFIVDEIEQSLVSKFFL